MKTKLRKAIHSPDAEIELLMSLIEAVSSDDASRMRDLLSHGMASCLSSLLQLGVPARLADQGFSLAMACCNANEPRCLALLIDAGADLAAASVDGSTAANLAQARGHHECSSMVQAWIDSRALMDTPHAPLGGKPKPRI